MFYADDLTYASETTGDREEIKKDIPSKLKSYNLFVNLGKTEEGEAPDKRPPPPPPPPPDKDPGVRVHWSPLDYLCVIPKMFPPEPTYKEIKLLGTKLDTKKDIISRKKQSVATHPEIQSLLQIQTPQHPTQNTYLQIVCRNDPPIQL